MENVVFTTDAHIVKEVHLKSIGKDFIDWGLHAIMAPAAWQKTKGESIKVAVLDTGVDPEHPDLKSRIKDMKDFSNSSTGVKDVQGHGTHVAGIIAGCDNGIGMVGVSPKVDLYIAKVLGDKGNGSYQSIINGMEWAIEKEVDIINMSLGSSQVPPKAFHEAIKKAYDKGIILIAATGNENSSVAYPARYDEVLAVGAIDQEYNKASFSNYGIKNQISAPGVDILSCYKHGQYAKLSGTSMATPIITGAAALYLSYLKKNNQPKPTVSELYKALKQATVDLGQEGKDWMYGAGVINLSKLL